MNFLYLSITHNYSHPLIPTLLLLKKQKITSTRQNSRPDSFHFPNYTTSLPSSAELGARSSPILSNKARAVAARVLFSQSSTLLLHSDTIYMYILESLARAVEKGKNARKSRPRMDTQTHTHRAFSLLKKGFHERRAAPPAYYPSMMQDRPPPPPPPALERDRLFRSFFRRAQQRRRVFMR